MSRMVDKDYVAPSQQGYIAYGLEPGVPEPDVNMATTAFVGPMWVVQPPAAPNARERAARWLDRNSEAMAKLADL